MALAPALAGQLPERQELQKGLPLQMEHFLWYWADIAMLKLAARTEHLIPVPSSQWPED